jgi:hypothetical protein
MITPKIVQVCMTHDGRISSVLYDNGRVFLFQYTHDPSGTHFGEGVWEELKPPLTSQSLPLNKRSKPTNPKQ